MRLFSGPLHDDIMLHAAERRIEAMQMPRLAVLKVWCFRFVRDHDEPHNYHLTNLTRDAHSLPALPHHACWGHQHNPSDECVCVSVCLEFA